jgi:hypothetical protein
MKKNAGVAQVRVSLEDGLTILDLKPDNRVTIAELRQIIKNNGFVSREVTAAARGAVSVDRKTFAVAGTNEDLPLSAPPQRSGDDWLIVVRPPDTR